MTKFHIRKVASAIAQGGLSFFLGAAVHPMRLFGNRLYEEVKLRPDVSPLDRNHADIAGQLIDLVGRPALSDSIADIISDHFYQQKL